MNISVKHSAFSLIPHRNRSLMAQAEKLIRKLQANVEEISCPALTALYRILQGGQTWSINARKLIKYHRTGHTLAWPEPAYRLLETENPEGTKSLNGRQAYRLFKKLVAILLIFQNGLIVRLKTTRRDAPSAGEHQRNRRAHLKHQPIKSNIVLN